MGLTDKIGIAILCAFVLFSVVRLFAAPLKLAAKVLLNTALGFLALFLLGLTEPVTGFSLGLNFFNALTVGILGTGKIGAAVIKNLSGFGCRILASDIRENPSLKGLCTYVDNETLYKACDIISLHMPLLESTRHFVNAETIAKMKDGVTIINCARGELMHIPDMIRGIETQKIGALALDVFDKEDGIYHENRRDDILSNRDMAYLRQFPNVIMTQHMAFYTDAAVQSMVYCGIEGLCDFARTGHTATELV